MVIEDELNEDGEQDIDGITFENYHGHFITYDYCPQIGKHWEVTDHETAPIYPVCMQTCCDVTFKSEENTIYILIFLVEKPF